MASYNEIVLEISEAVKIIDFREEFMKQNATKLLFPTVTKSLLEETDEREAEIVRQVTNWRIVNRHLVGHYGGPSGAYIVPNGAGGTNILGPDASIVLIQRFNMIKYKTVCMFLHHLFDFYLFLKFIIVELRSDSDSSLGVHEKMMDWMKGGVDEGMLVDPFTSMVKVYTRDAITNTIYCHEHHNCNRTTNIASRVLLGFVLSLYDIF
ncbi:13036_t:CDS:2 [Rhizophagus irregularis]|nr:13036_t:CDS:2 [Rhizophagus irregularis]